MIKATLVILQGHLTWGCIPEVTPVILHGVVSPECLEATMAACGGHIATLGRNFTHEAVIRGQVLSVSTSHPCSDAVT